MFQCKHICMKLKSFFEQLNKKINYYESCTVNPFEMPQQVICVWLSDAENYEHAKKNEH